MRSSEVTLKVHPFRVVSGSIDDWIDRIRSLVGKEKMIVLTSVRSIHGPEHLGFAVFHAMRAVSRGKNRARDPSIEILRRISGSKQVSTAIELTSPPGPGGDLLLLLIDPDIDMVGPPKVEQVTWDGGVIEGMKRLENPVWGGDSVKEIYGLEVSGDELGMAVLEMVALSDL